LGSTIDVDRFEADERTEIELIDAGTPGSDGASWVTTIRGAVGRLAQLGLTRPRARDRRAGY
jgi:hypothetical protein